jgi:hypothetical protein
MWKNNPKEPQTPRPLPNEPRPDEETTEIR